MCRPILHYDPWLFAEFVYDLCINFGIISFKSLGLRVFGDWSGKTVDDFKAERIKVVFDDRSAWERPWTEIVASCSASASGSTSAPLS